MLFGLAALGYLVPIGNRTLPVGEAAPFVLVALGFGVLSALYFAVTVLRGESPAEEEVIFEGEGAVVSTLLAVPLLVAAGGLVALGLLDLGGGDRGGIGALCSGPIVLVPAILMLGTGFQTRLRRDGSVVIARGSLWPRQRVYPLGEDTSCVVHARSSRGIRRWDVEVVLAAGERLRIGSWATPAAANTVAMRLRAPAR